MKKKILIISVAIMLLVSMTLSIFSLVMVDKLYQEKLEEKKSFSNNLEVGGFENYGISLMANTITTPDGYPMQLITASITPADPDILLEWTVEWKENKSHTSSLKESTEQNHWGVARKMMGCLHLQQWG